MIWISLKLHYHRALHNIAKQWLSSMNNIHVESMEDYLPDDSIRLTTPLYSSSYAPRNKPNSIHSVAILVDLAYFSLLSIHQQVCIASSVKYLVNK